MKHTSFRLLFSCLFLAGMALFFSSCRRNTVAIDSPPFDNSATTLASMYGQVVDESGQPVMDVSVKTGGHTFMTDKDGIFYFNKISTPKSATLITANKSGYFTGYRTLSVKSNDQQYTRIMLIEMKNPVTFNSVTGATVNVPNGGSITFPANALVYKSNGTPFTGTATLYARWLDPTSDRLGQWVPGALRGVDALNQERLLQTFGMMAAELFDNSGQALQLATDKSATLRFPLPSSITQYAPTKIPLWYFDSSLGLWKEEGFASREGSQYVGDVRHFSFWNCDVPGNFVTLDLDLEDTSGAPLANVTVKITNPATGGYAYGFTNSAGHVSGAVPNNATLTLEVIMLPCNTVVHTQTVTTLSSPVSLGIITVTPPPSSWATISGTVLDCSGSPVSNGFVSITTPGLSFIVPTNTTGGFTAGMVICSFPTTASVSAYDMTAGVHGNTTTNLVVGTNNLGALTACGVVNQFINWTSTVGGVPTSFSIVEPTGNFGASFNATGPSTFVEAYDSISTPNVFAYVSFDGLDAVTGSHNVLNFYDHLSTNGVPVGTIPVTLLNYQPVGGFIEGNFTGDFSGGMIPLRTVSCSFRVKRN